MKPPNNIKTIELNVSSSLGHLKALSQRKSSSSTSFSRKKDKGRKNVVAWLEKEGRTNAIFLALVYFNLGAV